MSIVSVDWSIRKPLYYYDGVQVKTTYNPLDIRATTILIETGVHKNLVYQLSKICNEILYVKGEETNKYRESKGIDKTDENDVRCIFELYNQSPELYKEMESRNIKEDELMFHIGRYYSYQETINKINNESKALQREYVVNNIYQNIIDYLAKEQEKHREEIIRISQYLHNNEVAVILHTKLMGEMNASIFSALVDVRKFHKYSQFKKFCGYASTDITHYNRKIKNLLWTSCDSTVIKHRLEPYRSLYDKYKERKLQEGKKKAHANILARRRVCQRMLKVLWQKLRNVMDKTNELDEIFKVTIPKRTNDSINVIIDVKNDSMNIRIGKETNDKKQKSVFDY